MIKTLISSAGGAGSTPGQGVKIPRASWPNKPGRKQQKQCCSQFNTDGESGPQDKGGRGLGSTETRVCENTCDSVCTAGSGAAPAGSRRRGTEPRSRACTARGSTTLGRGAERRAQAERGGTQLRSPKSLSWKKVLLLVPRVAGPGTPGLTFSAEWGSHWEAPEETVLNTDGSRQGQRKWGKHSTVHF